MVNELATLGDDPNHLNQFGEVSKNNRIETIMV